MWQEKRPVGIRRLHSRRSRSPQATLHIPRRKDPVCQSAHDTAQGSYEIAHVFFFRTTRVVMDHASEISFAEAPIRASAQDEFVPDLIEELAGRENRIRKRDKVEEANYFRPPSIRI